MMRSHETQYQGLNSAGSCRILDPAPSSWVTAPLFGDLTPTLGDPLGCLKIETQHRHPITENLPISLLPRTTI